MDKKTILKQYAFLTKTPRLMMKISQILNFDYNYYKNSNKSIKNYTFYQALDHYIQIGYHQGKFCNLNEKLQHEKVNKMILSNTEKTIYILGNGPSLKNIDLNLLNNEDTFCLNSVYKKFEELDFYPTYFGCFDPKLIECHHKQFVKLKTKMIYLIKINKI